MFSVPIGKVPLGVHKIRLMLIRWEYFNLIIAIKSIHESEDDTSGVVIDDLIDVQGGEIVLRKILIQILKINTNPKGTLFFLLQRHC